MWLESKDTPDGRGRRRGDPDFDERTVTVPEKFYKQLSGADAAASGFWLGELCGQLQCTECIALMPVACLPARSVAAAVLVHQEEVPGRHPLLQSWCVPALAECMLCWNAWIVVKVQMVQYIPSRCHC